jgi:hypothetical protein
MDNIIDTYIIDVELVLINISNEKRIWNFYARRKKLGQKWIDFFGVQMTLLFNENFNLQIYYWLNIINE